MYLSSGFTPLNKLKKKTFKKQNHIVQSKGSCKSNLKHIVHIYRYKLYGNILCTTMSVNLLMLHTEQRLL